MPLHHLPLLTFLLLRLVSAAQHTWPDAFRHINFDTTASPPFQLFSPSAIPHTWKVFPTRNPSLGPYAAHIWAKQTLLYNLNLTDTSIPLVDIKLGFAEVYRPLCRRNGRLFSVSVNDISIDSVNIFLRAGCATPHDLVFENVRTHAPIVIRLRAQVQNPMLANIIVRRASASSTNPPPLAVIASPTAYPSLTETPRPPVPTRVTEPSPIPAPSSVAYAPYAEARTAMPSASSSLALPPSASSQSQTQAPIPASSVSPALTLPSPKVAPPLVSPTTKSDGRGGEYYASAPMSLPISVREQALLLSAGKDNLRWANGGTAVFSVDKSVMIEGTVRPVEYHSYRHGKKFTYHFKGTGTYSIELGFAEINPEFCEGATRRIFTVLLNRQRLPSLTDVNVYKKVGCNRAFIETVTFPVAGDLFITFAASAADAMVSHIVVRRLQVDCVPASSNQGGITADHLAHAVPGEYPFIRSNTSPRSYVDANGDGFESVLINGDGSHSHFFDVVSKVSGRITRYEWTSPDTAEFLSQKVSFRFPFILGTTRIMLNVVDNLCSTDFAETSVTVTGSMVSGTYCYFYEGQTTLPGSGPADLEQKPSYSKGYTGTTWNFEALPFASSQFAAKCTFFLEVAEGVTQINGTISTKRSGRVSIYRGSEIALEDVRASPFSTSVAASLSSFEMVYVRDSFDQVPVVTLVVDSGTSHKVYHDRRTIFPVITSLQPPSSSTQGRRRVSIRVLGSSSKPKSVNVGDTVVPIAADSTASKVIFDVPASDAVGQVKISANWKGLIVSNALNFSYEIGPGKDPVEFAEVIMSEKNSERNAENGIATTIRIGPDGHIYLGTLNAEVVKLTYDMDTLTVTNRCGSYPLKDAKYSKDGVAAQRDILGMVFDPRDRFPRPYVSTQTLFYFYEGGRVDPNTTDAWANGAVDRLRPGRDRKNPYICLVHDKRIISGLPVSDHDHGVSGLEFTQDGDLLISVGGFTNLGLPGRRFGQRWEVPLSGSVILAKTSKGAVFNGNIKYSNMTHPEDGVMTSGDVKVVASGLRNAFFLSLHSSGRLYAMDNGPNNGYGNIAANCAEKDIDIIYPKDPPGNWPGTVKVDGPPWARFSTKRPDKLVHIKLDKIARYYGHPNFNRGECAWIDPFTGRDALDRAPPENYEAPLGMFESSVNAVIEYHAGNIFDGALKGQLILSTFKNRKTYAIRAISSGSEAKADVIAIHGGLSMAMNARGDLIVPRIKANNILVLRPKVPRLEGRETMSITAVTPFRHGRGGRTMATIGGYNFGGETVVVKIGGRRCRVRMQSDRVIRCRVPAAVMGGSVVDVTVRKRGGEIARLERGVWYMQV